MKWWLEVLAFVFYFGLTKIGFSIWDNWSILEWEWWAFSMPLVVAGYLGLKWCVEKNCYLEEKKRET